VSQLHVSHADHELHAVAHYLMNGTLALAALGIGIRLTRERGAARRQLLWIAPSALLLTGTFFWLQYGEHFNSHRDTLLSVSLLYAAYASVPICTAVAVLRYGLFDIELVVNRALVFFFATAFAACAYVLIVVALGSAVNDQTSFWPSLLATAVVAIAFQPLRQRAVRLADRLAYGAAAEPYDALADFSRRLGETPDPTDLLPAMADAAKGAVGARHATVELFMPSGLVETATAGGAALDAGSTTEIPIVDDGDRVGLLTVEMAPGRGLRPQDLTLLHDLIAQAVVAFRNARLSAELMHRVADLDRQATALEESRRRLIRAADAERMRLQRALNRDVAPRLATMPQRLEGLARGGAGAVIAERVQPLRLDAEHALDDLREITRGVYPAQLGRSGLVPALRSLLARTPNAQFTADADPDDPRVDARVEATAYYCVAEAIRGMTGPVEVVLVQQHEEVVVNVSGASAGDVSVDHMRDRVEAAAGSLAFWRTDERWMVEVRLPIPKLVGVGIGD
jgi:signal transduction histidine kinase